MRLAVWSLPAGLIAVILSPNILWAQAPSKPTFAMQINVQARLADGSPAPQSSLCELGYPDGVTLDRSEVDSSGKCHFVPSSHTIYRILVKAPGYLEATALVDLQNAQTGMAFLTLKPVPGLTPPVTPKDATSATVSAIDLSVPESARKELELAQQSLQKYDLDAGITHIKKAIKLHDQFPQAYAMLGTAYNEQKKWKDAQGALEKAIQQHPKAAEAYFQLGASLNQQKDFTGAVNSLNQGLQLNPDAPDAAAAHYELARAYMALGQWQDANPHAAKAVAMQPDVASWHILMGNIDLKKGDGQGAISEFQAYLKLDPNGPAAGSIRDMIPKIQAAMQKQ
jgi:tetratricopeptide (TPR) repeat protein